MAECEVEFKWGKKKGFGKYNHEVQFYESFTYDKVEYFLYDSVYLYVANDPEPYIGKLVKIWEENNKKKIKVVWFFRPIEIRNWLQGVVPPLKNEIFLGSGRGKGLYNVNPLDALVGKCKVVCSSKDRRNPQPSEIELLMADYVFYRTFDVVTRKISDKIGDMIGDFEVEHFFNRKPGQVQRSLEASKGDKTKTRPKKVLTIGGADVDKSLMQKKQFKSTSKLNLDSSLAVSKVNMSFKKSPKVESLPKNFQRSEHTVSPTSMPRREGNANVKQQQQQQRIIGSEGDAGKSPRPPQSVKEFVRQEKDLPQKMGPPKQRINLSIDAGRSLTPGKNFRTKDKALEVARTPDCVDKSRWFKHKWEDLLQTGFEKGTVVLLQNLDPSYSSSEVQEIIKSSFALNCDAKVLPQTAISSPHSGEAYAIFKMREEAEMVIAKLSKMCLVLPNGSPLLARKGIPPAPPRTPKKFIGHLSVSSIEGRWERPEMRNAVSTAHFPQPNTLEYPMAAEWSVLQKNSTLQWEALYKNQGKEINELKRKLTHK
ncbi:hypothetical protein Scep_008508 [Stephania cephalantha]|uniref:BAH domain-containing protein n=1 Tax=Stephania cephalantha TaxID=152367 RepID=A0AAP0KBU0_9MAGN